MKTLTNNLLQALETSDWVSASEQLKKINKGAEAWEIHLSLFPVVQRVLNPPFMNPHLPKMYRIYREFLPYLREEDILALVRLEVTEYTGRPKLEELSKSESLISSVSFKDIESAIRSRDREKAAAMMATFYSQKGKTEFARSLLLLGSGYLDDSLGHSVSCTSFILLEMTEREDQDPWPALATLADYFCKGGFHTTPALRKSSVFSPDEAIKHHLLRAASGQGIVNLHHTITVYAMERVRQYFSAEQYDHMIVSWIDFLGDKKAKQTTLEGPAKPAADYDKFYQAFSRLDAKSVLGLIKEKIISPQGRKQLGRFLIKGVCDQYQGNYNPHYLTGLGSALWVVNQYWNQPQIVLNALFQYLDFFFKGIKS